MTIKEVSEKYQITQDTLRYYERIGMIPAVPRTSGGIRNYGEADRIRASVPGRRRDDPRKTPSLTGTERTSDRTTEQDFANVKTPGIQDQSV